MKYVWEDMIPGVGKVRVENEPPDAEIVVSVFDEERGWCIAGSSHGDKMIANIAINVALRRLLARTAHADTMAKAVSQALAATSGGEVVRMGATVTDLLRRLIRAVVDGPPDPRPGEEHAPPVFCEGCPPVIDESAPHYGSFSEAEHPARAPISWRERGADPIIAELLRMNASDHDAASLLAFEMRRLREAIARLLEQTIVPPSA